MTEPKEFNWRPASPRQFMQELFGNAVIYQQKKSIEMNPADVMGLRFVYINDL